MDTTVGLSIGSFVLILAVLVLLRARNSRFEVKPADIVVAVLPIVVFLLVTGKLQKFEIGESGVKIETAFVKAHASAIVSQVTPLTGLPSEPIRLDPKRGVEDIPQLIARKTEGLLFRLGHGGYWGPAIEEYFRMLARQPFLKYLVIENPDGTFFALADARELTGLFQAERPPYTAREFAEWLNATNRDALARLPGFIASQYAVTKETDKGQALRRMEALNVDTLPVVDDKRRFAGIVNRSRLTASLLIDVSENLEK
ncbi:MAG: CBS domain-containing protein [bacterium]